jgi:hypothetical protein
MTFLNNMFASRSPIQNVSDVPSPMADAIQKYPILNKLGIKGVPGKANGNVLEFWPPGEKGGDVPRPSNLPIDVPGIEVGPNARPIDILGDVVSHHLVKTDSTIKKIYSTFSSSITPQQENILASQYKWAVKNNGEKRDFNTWRDVSGLPALFRGYPFQQWPDNFNKKVYTPKQMQLLDHMMQYLSGKQ